MQGGDYKFLFYFLLLFVVLLADSVVVLTPENIDAVLADNKNGILAPWCANSKKIALEYEAAAFDLNEEGFNVIFKEVDCMAYITMGKQILTQRFPNLIWFRNGEFSKYLDETTRSEIISWVKRNTLDQLIVCDKITLPTPPTFGLAVLFGKDNEGVYQKLLSGSRTIHDIDFVQASKSLIKSHSIKTGTVAVYKPDGSSQSFEASDNILHKISAFVYPKYMEFTQAHFSRLYEQKEAIVLGFAPYSDEKAMVILKSFMKSVADKYSNVGFLYGDSTLFAKTLSDAGASLNFLPTFVAIFNQEQFAWDEDVSLNAESLSKWIKNVLQGTAVTNKKSEPIPKSNDGPVVKLVYKNYKTYINSGKPIFVKYYDPWNILANNTAGDWAELGKIVKNICTTIAEYDVSANYSEEPIEELPTIIFYDGKGGKEIYKGNLSLEALLKFVNGKRENIETRIMLDLSSE